MILKRLGLATVASLTLWLGGPSASAQHGHLNAGASGTAPGSQLTFANGMIFALDSGYVKDLNYAASGPYAGLFEGNISLTALPATIDNGGPVPNAPALGSFVEARIVSVDGPAGGAFSFWDTDATSPTFTIASGTQGGTFRFDLSDAALGAGQPGADPFGHLHGRRFTATTEGSYTVAFKLFDVSANGPDFGPIHAPSDTLMIRFQAVPEPGTLSLLAAAGVVTGVSVYRKRRNARTSPPR